MIPIKRRIILFSFLACLATGCSDDNERSQDASCGIGQVLSPDENVCMCDADNHWVNSGNTCKCAGGYALNATKDTCEPIICSVRGQIYSDLIGNCICDSSNHWVAEESWCKCAKGYTLNATGDGCERIQCDARGQIYNEWAGKCTCDALNHWVEVGIECMCSDGYTLNAAGDACENNAQVSCNANGQILDSKTGQCICDTDNNWEKSGNGCQCAKGFTLNANEDACERVTCSVTGQIYSEQADRCVCDTSNYWETNGDTCKCMSGYQLNSTQDGCVQITCPILGQKYNNTTESCECDGSKHWIEDGSVCKCDENNHWVKSGSVCTCERGYSFQSGQCKPKTCSNANEKYDINTDRCVCDSDKHWTGSSGHCVCEDNMEAQNGVCECKGVIYNGKCVAVGSIVTFGSFYINNSAVKNPIEWIVSYADKSTGTLFLLSKYVLERKEFNNSTWSFLNTISTWLNTAFYEESFTDEEKALIRPDENEQITIVDSGNYKKIPQYVSLPTVSMMLSEPFDSRDTVADPQRIAYPTPFCAQKHSAFCSNGGIIWSTKTTGSDYVWGITCKGELQKYTINSWFGVRPTLIIQVSE